MRCMNEGCLHHSTTQMNYCMQYRDTDKCDEAEPRNLPQANVKPLLDDVAEVEWIRHARGLPFDDVLECYINDIESITNCHTKHNFA